MAVSALVQDRTLGPVNRTFAFSLAGDILDAQDRTAEAFAAYGASKAIQRDAFAPSMVGFESVATRELRLADYFRRVQNWPSASPSQEGPQTHVFLVGFPRSGTTLLEQVLASHPGVATMEERPCLIDSVTAFFGANADLDRLAALSDAELQSWRDAYWKRVAETETSAAKPVFVVLSCFRRRFAMNAGMFEFTALESTAAYYAAVMNLVDIYRGKLALDVTEARHESLVGDFDGEASRLCGFLGLEFNDAMRAFASRARDQKIDTPSAAQVARGLSDAGVAQWRRYGPQLEPVFPVLAPFVARFGYPEN
jgi:hypothetical protein